MKEYMIISSIFTNEHNDKKHISKIIEDNNLTDHLSGFFKSETHTHTQNVSIYSKKIAQYLNLTNHQVHEIAILAPFHDFGKLAIPEEILNKKGRLTDEEFEIIKEHPKLGYEYLYGKNKFLNIGAQIALEHHEKWDGTGYPHNISGDKTHLYSRIVSIADVIDSLLSDRCYKKAWSKEDVMSFFKEQNGKQFDPKITQIVIDNFYNIIKEANLHS